MNWHQFFTDTVTVYHRGRDASGNDTFTRTEVQGVMYKRVSQRTVGTNGLIAYTDEVHVTFLPGSYPGGLLAVGDIIVQGTGPAFTTLGALRKACPDAKEVRSIAENLNKPMLKHRKAVCA